MQENLISNVKKETIMRINKLLDYFKKPPFETMTVEELNEYTKKANKDTILLLCAAVILNSITIIINIVR